MNFTMRDNSEMFMISETEPYDFFCSILVTVGENLMSYCVVLSLKFVYSKIIQKETKSNLNEKCKKYLID